MPYYTMLSHATSSNTMPCCATQPDKPHGAMVEARSPMETKGRHSAGRRSLGLRGGISAVCVQSHGRLGPGARQEGAEQPGRVFKPIGSQRSQQGRGKGAACLVIALINQACSEQDPTLSMPRLGLCHPRQRQVPHHPLPGQLCPSSVTVPSCPHRPSRSIQPSLGQTLLRRWLPSCFPVPIRQQGSHLGSSWRCSPWRR